MVVAVVACFVVVVERRRYEAFTCSVPWYLWKHASFCCFLSFFSLSWRLTNFLSRVPACKPNLASRVQALPSFVPFSVESGIGVADGDRDSASLQASVSML